MEIAPVAGVRAVSLQHQPKASNAAQPRFEIDASERTEDDTYSPDARKQDAQAQDRAPEQESRAIDEEASAPESATEPTEGSTINVVA